jgi:hypothetical protein
MRLKKRALKWDPAMHEWNCGRLVVFNKCYVAKKSSFYIYITRESFLIRAGSQTLTK